MADRYISEKALIEEIAKIADLRKLSTKTVGIAISATPTADVVEVVRCKDCCNSEQCGSVLYCTHFSHNVEENDYCSQGG